MIEGSSGDAGESSSDGEKKWLSGRKCICGRSSGTAGEALQYYGSTYAGCRCLLGPCRERHLRGGELNNCQTRVAVVTEREEENGILPLGLNENIDAIFCIKMLPPEYMQKLVNLGYRIFQLDHYCGIEQRPMGDIVRVDGVQPVSLLTSHLIGQGMTRIGFLSEHSSTYESMHDRYVGFLAAMEQAGIPLDEELVRPNMESDHFYYPENFDKIVASYDTLPEAIVCGNDMIAKRLTESFRKIGVRVPEDVALTGFDDDEDRMLYPFFSTVHVDTKWLGRRMVHEFLWREEHPEAPKERILVSGEVVVRRSSCKRQG